MSAERSLGFAGILVSAVVIATACVAINESVTGRDLDCGTVPEDVCIRAVDVAQGYLGADVRREFPSGEFTIVVNEDVACDRLGAHTEALRCMSVMYTHEDGSGIGVVVAQLPDGTLEVD